MKILHNYERKLQDLINAKIIPTLTQPGVHDIKIEHDDWCLIYKGGFCNCNPDVFYNGKKVEP